MKELSDRGRKDSRLPLVATAVVASTSSSVCDHILRLCEALREI